MPVRDPSEKMLRVGHGFSKMLSQLKPDMSKITENKANRPASGRNLSLDPDVVRSNDFTQEASTSVAEYNKTDTSPLAKIKSSRKISKIKISKTKNNKNPNTQSQPKLSQSKLKNAKLPKIESSKHL